MAMMDLMVITLNQQTSICGTFYKQQLGSRYADASRNLWDATTLNTCF